MDSEKWKSGAKDLSKKEIEEQKRLEALAKKAEREALLAAEEAENGGKGSKGSGSSRKPGISGSGFGFSSGPSTGVESYAASGIDDALNLLDLATKGASASNSDKLDRHPERRVKSAYAVFEEREMPILKAENPGLRLSQLKQMLQKKWKKSPENPLNQQNVAYDATREEEKEVIASTREDALKKYTEK